MKRFNDHIVANASFSICEYRCSVGVITLEAYATGRKVPLVLYVAGQRQVHRITSVRPRQSHRARNVIIKKPANANWGTYARTIRSRALALCSSSSEYASPDWSRSLHASKIDPVLKSTHRAVSGGVRPTRVYDLYLLCGIPHPHISDGQSHPILRNTNKKTTLASSL